MALSRGVGGGVGGERITFFHGRGGSWPLGKLLCGKGRRLSYSCLGPDHGQAALSGPHHGPEMPDGFLPALK